MYPSAVQWKILFFGSRLTLLLLLLLLVTGSVRSKLDRFFVTYDVHHRFGMLYHEFIGL
jgi:hypothetical protein